MSFETLTFILAYQRGENLGALTEHRPQAAVPFGGEYRIVDFCLSNVLHSGLRQIYVATQYRSRSLHAHLRSGWSVFSPELGQFIEPLPPQMKAGPRWYEGAVDVLIQNLDLIEQSDAETVLLLNGNAVYRMDYAALLAAHHASGAAATVAHGKRRALQSTALDWLEVDESGSIAGLRSSRGAEQLRAVTDDDMEVEVGIGVVAFSREVLLSRLTALAQADRPAYSLGRDLLSGLIADGEVKGVSVWRQARPCDPGSLLEPDKQRRRVFHREHGLARAGHTARSLSVGLADLEQHRAQSACSNRVEQTG